MDWAKDQITDLIEPAYAGKYIIWVLRMDIGSMGAFRMNGAGYVLPVRAGQ